MGYRERIETAVIALSENDREAQLKFKSCGCIGEALADALDLEDSCDIALDLLSIPKDNTLDYSNEEGHDPVGCFCRDGYYHVWRSCSGQSFINYCYKALKEFAENNLTFTKPGKRNETN
jgi:hypothetical protein